MDASCGIEGSTIQMHVPGNAGVNEITAGTSASCEKYVDGKCEVTGRECMPIEAIRSAGRSTLLGIDQR